MQPGLSGELAVEAAEIAPAVRGEEAAGIVDLFSPPEQGAEDPCHLGIPRQGTEGVDVRQAHQLGRFGPVADVLPVTVDEEVGGGAVDQLESLGGDGGPVGGGDPFAHDTAGDRDELEVDVGDALALNATGHLVRPPRPARPDPRSARGLSPWMRSLLGKRCSPIVNNGRSAGKPWRVSILLTLGPRRRRGVPAYVRSLV